MLAYDHNITALITKTVQRLHVYIKQRFHENGDLRKLTMQRYNDFANRWTARLRCCINRHIWRWPSKWHPWPNGPALGLDCWYLWFCVVSSRTFWQRAHQLDIFDIVQNIATNFARTDFLLFKKTSKLLASNMLVNTFLMFYVGHNED